MLCSLRNVYLAISRIPHPHPQTKHGVRYFDTFADLELLREVRMLSSGCTCTSSSLKPNHICGFCYQNDESLSSLTKCTFEFVLSMTVSGSTASCECLRGTALPAHMKHTALSPPHNGGDRVLSERCSSR